MAAIIERFTPDLVPTIGDSVQSVADACLANGLIGVDTSNDILESPVTSGDKARKLLKAVKNTIGRDRYSSCSFNLFLRVLDEKLPEQSRNRLLTKMRAEQTTALVPAFNTDHSPRTLFSMYNGQLSVPVAVPHACLLHQEQGPLIGMLEDSIREYERTVAKKKLLKEKLEENERLKAQLASIGQSLLSSNASENRGTTTSISEDDILQLKKKVEELEQNSKDLGRDMRRYRCAIDAMGEEILKAVQSKLEFQYERRFQELKTSMMREPQQYGSYYKPNYESDSRERSYYDVPSSKPIKTESGSSTKADDVDDAVHCKFTKFICIAMYNMVSMAFL